MNSEQPADFGKQIFLSIQMMLGTGVFVGLGIATPAIGMNVIWAIGLAAVLALFNSMAEAQRALSLSVPESDQSGGPLPARWLQFTIDWALFLARLAAVATAVLGLAGYGLNALLISPVWQVPAAIMSLILLAIAAIQRRMVTRFSQFGGVVSVVTLLGLVGIGLPQGLRINQTPLAWVAPRDFLPTLTALLQATTLMTAAYSGFESCLSRPAFMSIQQALKAMQLAIGLIGLLLVSVAVVMIGTVPPTLLESTMLHTASLAIVMRQLAFPGGVALITLGAVTAFAGTVFALLPKLADRLVQLTQPIDGAATWQMQRAKMMLSPRAAWIWVIVAISCIALVGDVQGLWSFSAVMFLIHAALLHFAALKPGQIRLQSRWLHGMGLAGCVFLIFWLDWTIWLFCLGLVAVGVLWYGMTQWSEAEE